MIIFNNGLPITNETATPIPFITEANAVARVLSSTGNQVAERRGAPPIATGPPGNRYYEDYAAILPRLFLQIVSMDLVRV